MIRRPPRSTLFPTRRSSDLLDLNHWPWRCNFVFGTYLFQIGDGRTIQDAAKCIKTRTMARAIPGFFAAVPADRKSTRLNSSHLVISYAVFCLKTKALSFDDL